MIKRRMWPDCALWENDIAIYSIIYKIIYRTIGFWGLWVNSLMRSTDFVCWEDSMYPDQGTGRWHLSSTYSTLNLLLRPLVLCFNELRAGVECRGESNRQNYLSLGLFRYLQRTVLRYWIGVLKRRFGCEKQIVRCRLRHLVYNLYRSSRTSS